MTRDAATGRFAKPWNVANEMRARMGSAIGVGVAEPAPEAPAAEAPAEGIGGGVQSAAVPAGQSFADEVRRRAFSS